MMPYTVYLQTGAFDIIPCFVKASDIDNAFINATAILREQFPTYTGTVRAIATSKGWDNPENFKGHA